MKNLILRSAVIAVMSAGAAHADITLDGTGRVTVTPTNTYDIYLSGSSAALDFIEQILTNAGLPTADQLCDSTKPIYKFADNNVANKNQNAYYCSINPSNTALSGLAAGKTELLIYKRSSGGSAQGVAPLVAEAKGAAGSAISFLFVDPSVCDVPSAGPGLRVAKCTFTDGTAGQYQSHVSDFGVSDVDPGQFTGLNTPSGFTAVTASDVGLLNVSTAAAQVFGIPVTLSLRNALQNAQFPTTSVCNPTNAGYTTGFNGTAESEACMPSLTRDQVGSILAGKLNSWDQLRIGTTGLYAMTTATAPNVTKPTSSRLHVCTRTNGSGTKATTGINFLNYPCTAAATALAVDTGTTGEAIAKTQVHALASSGNVTECLDELDSGSNTVGTAFNNTYGFRWAIGIQGTDQNVDLAHAWRFIKIDGAAPTMDNVALGLYHDWAELSFQTNKTHVWDQSEDGVVNEFIRVAGSPVVMGALRATASFGDTGFLANPKNFAPNVNGILDHTSPVNPYSHATTGAAVNNCRVPAVYNLSNPAGAGVQLY
ncbi:hypothetical protein [Methylomicrobium lacus]|uniref:hypothetical protein n=1 Tax=Methylomicrobium lacus TaxID=136992 RepID=UPI0035A81A1A